jgi:hypothetical protein
MLPLFIETLECGRHSLRTYNLSLREHALVHYLARWFHKLRTLVPDLG